MKKLHLFCNAHLDVIWLWQLEEAMAAALSTFRVATELCEKQEHFVFNHNEAILYQWVEEHDPDLFRRIQKLVAEGKWKIVGGWYLQPDCLMPSGEAFIRQIAYGRKYFKEKFGVIPETVNNLDSFGHARGLVQIMYQAGYRYYMFMRPEANRMTLPQLFEWRGYDEESSVVAFRLNTQYNTGYGKAAGIIEEYIKENEDMEVAMRCWGVGNHGGGPSRRDVEEINRLMEKYAGKVEIVHSDPDKFFHERMSIEKKLPIISEDIIPSWVGCYSTMVRIKQLYRKLEHMLFSAEKISVACKQALGMEFPAEKIKEAIQAMLVLQFHDVLPGTCVKPAEEDMLRLGNYGLEILNRIHAKAMFALTAGEKAAPNEWIPIFVWNPHPYEVDEIVECEFMLSDQNWDDTFTMVHAFVDGKEISCQIIKEDSNFNLDWRKRVAFQTKFKPMAITRIDFEPYLQEKPIFKMEKGEVYYFDNGDMQVQINRNTGLIDSYRVRGKEFLKPGAFRLEVFYDSADPWRVDSMLCMGDKKGEYTLLDGVEAAKMSGVRQENYETVRLVEDGDVFVRVEALFGYNDSRARILYTMPKKGIDFQVDITSFFAEKDTCLRMTIPVEMCKPSFSGQSVYGTKPLYQDGTESEAQGWIAAHGEGGALILVNNGTYGSSNQGNMMRQTLLRSTAYSGHPLLERPFMEYNRYLPRTEQGERSFHFRVAGVCEDDMITTAEHMAALENERLLAYNIFPKGEGKNVESVIRLSDSRIRLSACKVAEEGEGYIIRLFNPMEDTITTQIEIPMLGFRKTVQLKHHQVQSYRVTEDGGRNCGILE